MKWGQTIVTEAAVAAAHEVGRSDVDAGDVVSLSQIDCPPRPLHGIIGARRCSQLSIDSGRRRRYVPAQLTGGFAECQVLCTAHVLETRSADPFTKYLTICRKTVVRYFVNSGPLIWYIPWSALTLLVELSVWLSWCSTNSIKASGRASGLQKLSSEVLVVVICLEWGADCLHMVSWCHCRRQTLSSLASFNFRLVLPFSYHLSQVVLEKGALNGRSSSSSTLKCLLTGNMKCSLEEHFKMTHLVKHGEVRSRLKATCTKINMKKSYQSMVSKTK